MPVVIVTDIISHYTVEVVGQENAIAAGAVVNLVCRTLGIDFT